MMDKGKDLVSLLRSNTELKIIVLDRSWWRKILGFRSKTKWKMAVAIVVYIFMASRVVGAFTGSNATAPPNTVAPAAAITVAAPVQTPEQIAQAKTVADAKAVEDKKVADAAAYQTWIKGQFSVWDGSNTYLVDLVKNNLNDAKSFEHVETKYVDKGSFLIVKMTYRAKNAFGGVILQNVTANSDYKTDTIKITSQND